MITISESGMTFGPYREENCFYVEQSRTYAQIQTGLKIAEFLLLRSRENQAPRLFVVEAKSSSPRAANAARFAEFIEEVRDKLTNGLTLMMTARLQRHEAAEEELSHEFKAFDLRLVEIRLVLVINGHQPEWLVSIQNALAKALHSLVRTWALGAFSVVVVNEQGARRHGLICQ